MKTSLLSIIAILGSAAAGPIQAAQSMPESPAAGSSYSCRQQEAFRAFDFWIGDWEVRTADGKLAGHNSIESSQQGCVLLERWTSVSGNTGLSINYFDGASGQWVQIWTDAGGGQIDIRGGPTGDGMLLEGQIHYLPNGTTAAFRGHWTPLSDGRVRQFFEQSNDGGETWEPWFEGFYSRLDENETPTSRASGKSTDSEI